MRRTPFTSAALLCALGGTVLVGCGDTGDREPDEIAADISAELQSGATGLPEADADCIAEVLVEEVGAEELEDVDLSAEEPPEGLAEDIAAAMLLAADRCELDAAALGG